MIGHAKQLFDKMPTRDLVTWTVMIAGYAEVEMQTSSGFCLIR